MMKFSIVTVSYNAEELIENTIKSVLDQQFEDFEYIIIDGASTDETVSIIKKYDMALSYWVSEKDTGIYNAMNKAVSKSKGEWILFLNAGDTFSSDNVLERVASYCVNENDLIYGDRHRVNESGHKIYEKAGILDDAYCKEVVFHQSLFTRKELLKERPYLESYKLAADYEFMLYALKADKKFAYINISISDFLEGGRSRQNYLLAQIEAIKASLHHNSDLNTVRKNFYLENLVLQNMGFYINKTLQVAKSQKSNFYLKTQTVGKGVKLVANNPSESVDSLLKRLNPSLSLSRSPDLENGFTILKLTFKKKLKKLVRSISTKRTPNVDLADDSQSLLSLNSSSAKENNDNNLKITVVTVCYNSGTLLEATIKSVLFQSYKNIEYIIVDGNSTDETPNVLSKYQTLLSKIISEPDNGIYDAMNKAVDYASGDYLIYMNAGDCFHDDDVVTRIFADKSISTSLIYGARIYQNSDGGTTYQPARELNTVFYRMPYCHQSLFLKTTVLKKFRFNTTYRFAADYEQSVRLFLADSSYTILDEPICIFIQGGASETGLMPYIESIKILMDNCKDVNVIKNNVYYSSFVRNFKNIIDI